MTPVCSSPISTVASPVCSFWEGVHLRSVVYTDHTVFSAPCDPFHVWWSLKVFCSLWTIGLHCPQLGWQPAWFCLCFLWLNPLSHFCWLQHVYLFRPLSAVPPPREMVLVGHDPSGPSLSRNGFSGCLAWECHCAVWWVPPVHWNFQHIVPFVRILSYQPIC